METIRKDRVDDAARWYAQALFMAMLGLGRAYEDFRRAAVGLTPAEHRLAVRVGEARHARRGTQ